MILVLLAAVIATCDPALTALFTPLRPAVGRYDVCTTDQPLERVTTDTAEEPGGPGAPGRPHYAPSELLDPLDAFGAAGSYSRAALARLYNGQRVRVARGWVDRDGRFESITLLSPYPDATLTKLVPGTMVIRWTMVRP
jgi:hypothetical protein